MKLPTVVLFCLGILIFGLKAGVLIAQSQFEDQRIRVNGIGFRESDCQFDYMTIFQLKDKKDKIAEPWSPQNTLIVCRNIPIVERKGMNYEIRFP